MRIANQNVKRLSTRKHTDTVVEESHSQVFKTFSKKRTKWLAQPFGSFAESALDLMNAVFTPMFHNCHLSIWNNGEEGRVKKAYKDVDFDVLEAEWYIPIQSNAERNMQFYRIALKILPEVDHQTIVAWLPHVTNQKVYPPGVLDSETIVFVSPKKSERAIREKQTQRYGGKLRGFRHEKKKGYMTFIGINESPYILVTRVVEFISNFLRTRLKALLKSLNLESYQLDYQEPKRLYYSNTIIEYIPSLIRQTAMAMSRSLEWLTAKASYLRKEIGRMNQAREALKKLPELAQTLKDSGLKSIKELGELSAKLLKATCFDPSSIVKPLKYAFQPKKRKITGYGHYSPMEYAALLKNKRFNTDEQPDRSMIKLAVSLQVLPKYLSDGDSRVVGFGQQIRGDYTLKRQRFTQAPKEVYT